MSHTLEELLRSLAAAGRGVDVSSLVDDIEALVEDDPAGSRTAVWSFTGDEVIRLRLVGFLGDPRDADVLAAGLAGPQLRRTALEGLTNQPDVERVDAVARSLLDDADPMVRSRPLDADQSRLRITSAQRHVRTSNLCRQRAG
ncbi:hypothetical protein ACFPIJ_11035 [Dactylosporangium cerinum]|uniref:Uncharacterized protein n=1 Tax=Dactylosporangium cerinum TaxID=1434730 RepID=A0ABV9VSX2_9ACTN